jgi:hypothetical protein
MSTARLIVEAALFVLLGAVLMVLLLVVVTAGMP